MSLEFLSPAESALARSPMEREARAAGARVEQRDGWNVAVRFDGEEPERERCESSGGLRRPLPSRQDRAAGRPRGPGSARGGGRGGETLELGRPRAPTVPGGARTRPTRALVLCEPADAAALRARLEEAGARARGTGQRDRRDHRVRRAHGGRAARPASCSRASAPSTCARRSPRPRLPARCRWRAPRARSCARREQRYLMLFGAALGQLHVDGRGRRRREPRRRARGDWRRSRDA